MTRKVCAQGAYRPTKVHLADESVKGTMRTLCGLVFPKDKLVPAEGPMCGWCKVATKCPR